MAVFSANEIRTFFSGSHVLYFGPQPCHFTRYSSFPFLCLFFKIFSTVNTLSPDFLGFFAVAVVVFLIFLVGLFEFSIFESLSAARFFLFIVFPLFGLDLVAKTGDLSAVYELWKLSKSNDWRPLLELSNKGGDEGNIVLLSSISTEMFKNRCQMIWKMFK